MNREEFLEAAKGSFTTEMGSFGTTTGDEKKFGGYICKNWRTILEEYDSLLALKTDSMHGIHYLTIPVACENLDPPEYLDFLDRVLEIHEQKKARGETIGYADLLFFGQGRKKSFLAVNWENPRVRGILLRAVRLLSDLDPDAANFLQRQANGELADNYMTGEPDNAPLPETLSGIKLKRPWDSLIKKFELITGQKVPHDPKFDPRPSRRDGGSAQSGEARTSEQTNWGWLVLGGVLSAIVFSIWKLRGRRNIQA